MEDIQVRYRAGMARKASYLLPEVDITRRNRALMSIQAALRAHADDIFAMNAQDIKEAHEDKLAAPMVKRLTFDQQKLDDAIAGIDALIALPDPLGHTILARELAEGLELYRVSCPIGVIGVVFESRPDALVQIATLCLKSGNAVLLKGGREAVRTNRALYEAIREGAQAASIPDGWITLFETRDEVTSMLALDEYIDLIIPRGSNAFVRYIMDNTRIAVMGHADGLCHLYIDKAADVDMALRIALDAKTQSYAVCNAIETLLVHADMAPSFLAPCAALLREKGVEIVGCPRTCTAIGCTPAQEDDWKAEYLAPVVSIKVVDDIAQAVAHINFYGSHHTDAIVTADDEAAKFFLTRVDSAGVYRNCSTRFADGYRYGFGAEVGIATGKLHARGPVGLEGLCTYKYKLLGSGQTVGDTLDGSIAYTHVDLNKDCPL